MANLNEKTEQEVMNEMVHTGWNHLYSFQEGLNLYLGETTNLNRYSIEEALSLIIYGTDWDREKSPQEMLRDFYDESLWKNLYTVQQWMNLIVTFLPQENLIFDGGVVSGALVDSKGNTYAINQPCYNGATNTGRGLAFTTIQPYWLVNEDVEIELYADFCRDANNSSNHLVYIGDPTITGTASDTSGVRIFINGTNPNAKLYVIVLGEKGLNNQISVPITLSETRNMHKINFKMNGITNDISLYIDDVLEADTSVLYTEREIWTIDDLIAISEEDDSFDSTYFKLMSDIDATATRTMNPTESSVDWNIDTGYDDGDIINYNGNRYISLKGSNTGNTPDSTSSEEWWAENNYEGFKGIGDHFPDGFEGKFDGNGYEIQNLYMNRPRTPSQGLFQLIRNQNALIQNIGLTDCFIYGRWNVGALCGNLSSIKYVKNCYSTGTIKGSQRCIGGLVGNATNSLNIYDCHSTCNVTGTINKYDTAFNSNVGGLVGTSASIYNSYATGNVKGLSYIGGLSGGDSGSFYRCYATGNVEAIEGYAGGLAPSGGAYFCYATGNVTTPANAGGLLYTGKSENSYATGAVNASSGKVGGLIGYKGMDHTCTKSYSTGEVNSGNAGDDIGGLIGDAHLYSGNATYSYWDTETSKQATSHAGEGRTTAQMKQKETYVTFSFGEGNKELTGKCCYCYWEIDSEVNDGYPYIVSEEILGNLGNIGVSSDLQTSRGSLIIGSKPNGTEYFPFRICGIVLKNSHIFYSDAEHFQEDTIMPLTGHDIVCYLNDTKHTEDTFIHDSVCANNNANEISQGVWFEPKGEAEFYTIPCLQNKYFDNTAYLYPYTITEPVDTRIIVYPKIVRNGAFYGFNATLIDDYSEYLGGNAIPPYFTWIDFPTITGNDIFKLWTTDGFWKSDILGTIYYDSDNVRRLSYEMLLNNELTWSFMTGYTNTKRPLIATQTRATDGAITRIVAYSETTETYLVKILKALKDTESDANNYLFYVNKNSAKLDGGSNVAIDGEPLRKILCITCERGVVQTIDARRPKKHALGIDFTSERRWFDVPANTWNNVIDGARYIVLSAWVNTYGVDGNNTFQGIFHEFISADSVGIILVLHKNGVTNNYKITVYARSGSADSMQSATANTVLNPNTFYQICSIIDYTAKSIKIYINGALDKIGTTLTFANNVYVKDNGNATRFGDYTTVATPQRDFRGILAKFTLDIVLPTDAEILADYNKMTEILT